MGLFDRFRKRPAIPDPQNAALFDIVFTVHLLMKEPPAIPAPETLNRVMRKHLGKVDCFIGGKEFAFVNVNQYRVRLSDGKYSPQLMITAPMPTETMPLDDLTRSQMWDCPESKRILEECKYRVMVMDKYACLLPCQERAALDMDCLEALMELYPQCEAVFFQTSGKMLPRDRILGHDLPKEDRFVHFAVNARFFRIEDTDEFIVDTLGMGLLGLPDVQYHFRNFDQNQVVRHAYNTAAYLCKGARKIENGDTIDGIRDGKISSDARWKCRWENAMVKPERTVLDICMNEYAAGKRE